MQGKKDLQYENFGQIGQNDLGFHVSIAKKTMEKLSDRHQKKTEKNLVATFLRKSEEKL